MRPKLIKRIAIPFLVTKSCSIMCLTLMFCDNEKEKYSYC